MILLDSSLLISTSFAHQNLSRAPSQQSGASTPVSLLATPAGIWSFADGRYLSANMTTRGEIMAFILTNPGVYLREISEDLGLSTGVVQYHTWVLTRNGEVQEYRSGRYRRFFGAAKYGEEERMVISLLRQGTTGRIVVALSGDQPLTHTRLAAFLGVTSQALSWQVRRLKATGIVETVVIQGQPERGYRLVDRVLQCVRAMGHPAPRSGPELARALAVR